MRDTSGTWQVYYCQFFRKYSGRSMRVSNWRPEHGGTCTDEKTALVAKKRDPGKERSGGLTRLQ